jgi:hypothetical protein
MKTLCAVGVSSVLAAAGLAQAQSILQFDVNSFAVQSQNSAGQASAFGGLSHTGSINFSMIANTTVLNGMFGTTTGGPLANLGFNGSLSNFTGQINLVNGQVTGGSLTIAVNGGTDTYTTSIGSGGQVQSYVGGGYKIEGLTGGGGFSDSQFGNVDVSPWFNLPLIGSFLQFNWIPDSNGAGSGDMDIFVTVVPLPTAAWAGLAMLGGIAVARKARRRQNA